MTQPYLEIEPASAKAKPWDKVVALFDHKSWILEPKLDGWRFLLHAGRTLPRNYLTGRHISKKTDRYSEKGLCAPHISFLRHRAVGYTVLDGEIMPPPGATFRDLAGIMNVDPAKAAQRIQEIGEPTYHVFDCLYFNGEDIRRQPFSGRRSALEFALDQYYSYGITLVTQHPTDKESHYNRMIADGGEGAILKNIHAPYGDTAAWVKVKRIHTLDVVVTGFTDAEYGKTGKFEGLIGAIKVSVYHDHHLMEVGNVSGMDDATRQVITHNKSRWLGKVIEIRAQELAKDRLRHPRFVRIRIDADPHAATLTKMLTDLKGATTNED